MTAVLPTGTSLTQRDVPVPVPGTHLYGCQPGSGYVTPPSLVRRADGQVLQLTALLYAVLDAVDGQRDVEAVARVAGDACARELHTDDVQCLIDDKLRPLGLVLGADGSCPPLKKANPLLALRPRFVVSRPELTRRVTAPFAALFHPVLVVVVTLAFAAVAGWVLFAKGLASAAYEAFHTPGLLLAVFGITIVSAGFHEFGHAAGLRRGGGTPGAMGAGLYLIWPAFYTDVTDSYRLSRAARLRTDLGGLYFNAIVALAMYGLWVATRWDGLLLVIAAQILQMIRQLPPLVRFDGYHILADVTGVPDLFHRIGPTLRSFLPRRWRRVEARELKLWVRCVVTAWVVLVVPLLLATVLLTVLALPRILGTTRHSVALQWHGLTALAGAGDWTGAGVKLLAILALVLPVGGILLMMLRMARRYAVRTWHRTQGRPVKRGIAALVATAMLGGLAYAWWPHGGNYRPIEPGERGTVQSAVQASALRQIVPSSLSAPVPTLREGEQRSVTTVWPADGQPLPTRDHPAVAIVLTPKVQTPDAQTWVFPFNRPDAPGPGGNQAMAIVTKDGGTAYDVAFALVWADDNTVLNRNEAYAFASCDSCRALAVSFQVVLVVGHANVIAPQNIAAAVSYNCLKCITDALAVQLVVTLPDDFSSDAKQALEKLWGQIADFGNNLQGLTYAEIRAKIADYERQILAIVAPDAVTSSTVDGATPTATPSTGEPSMTGSSTPSPTGTDVPTATTTATDQPTDTASSDASASPSPTGSSASPTPSSDTGTPTPSPS